jgi:transposase-like protein
MARPKDPNLDRAWRQRIQRHASSGLSIAAICRREGLSARLLYIWKARLKARSHSVPRDPPLFVPLRGDSRPRKAGPVPGLGVEMELPHEVRLHFDAFPSPIDRESPGTHAPLYPLAARDQREFGSTQFVTRSDKSRSMLTPDLDVRSVARNQPFTPFHGSPSLRHSATGINNV